MMFRKPSGQQTASTVFPTFLQSSLPFRRKSRQSSSDSCFSTRSTFSATSKSTTSTQSSNPFSRCPTPVPVPVQEEEILEPTDKFLRAHNSHIQCAKCSTDLALTSQIISKGFVGRHGRAYLVQGGPLFPGREGMHTHAPVLPNTYLGKAVPRSLVTGQHTVSDVSCAMCGTLLGWKYVEAAEGSQKYKVGKFILETKRIRVSVNWEDSDADEFEEQWEEVGPIPTSELRKIVDTGAGHLGAGAGARPAPRDVIEFDSQDEDECEDLFAGVWSPALAKKRRQRRRERMGRRATKVILPVSSSRESLASGSRDSSQPGSRMA